MHLSSWTEMNDILEGVFKIQAHQNANISSATRRLQRFKKHFLVSCFCKAQTDDGADVLKNHLMWAHYASHHTGVAIEFETTETALSKFGIAFSDVFYRNAVPTVSLPELMSAVDDQDGEKTVQLAKKLLSCKLEAWKYEQEWRLLVEADHEGVETLKKQKYLKIQSSSHVHTLVPLRITKVFLGSKFRRNRSPEVSRKKLSNLVRECKKLGVESLNVAQMYPESFCTKEDYKNLDAFLKGNDCLAENASAQTW